MDTLFSPHAFINPEEFDDELSDIVHQRVHDPDAFVPFIVHKLERTPRGHAAFERTAFKGLDNSDCGKGARHHLIIAASSTQEQLYMIASRDALLEILEFDTPQRNQRLHDVREVPDTSGQADYVIWVPYFVRNLSPEQLEHLVESGAGYDELQLMSLGQVVLQLLSKFGTAEEWREDHLFYTCNEFQPEWLPAMYDDDWLDDQEIDEAVISHWMSTLTPART